MRNGPPEGAPPATQAVRRFPPPMMPADVPPARQPAVLRWFLALAIGACVLAIALNVASQLSAYQVQDDAYIYERYADNILRHGRASWDPVGAPAYGATSHLYLLVVMPLRALLPHSPALAIGLASLVSGIAALIGLAILCTRGVGATASERPWLFLFIAVPLAGASERLAAHMTNGMDTMMGVAALTLLLLLWTEQQRAPTRARAWMIGVWGALCYASRPDLALYALAIPASVAWFSSGSARKLALGALVISAAGIAAELAWANWYYGTPFPLSFYVKSLHSSFGAEFRKVYAGVPLAQLQAYALSYWPLLAVIAVDCAFHFRRFISGGGGLRAGVAVATLLYVSYYLFGVVQVVAFHQRFYYPTLPALCLLASWSAVDLSRELKLDVIGGLLRIPKPALALVALCALRILAPPVLASVDVVRDELSRDHFANFDLLERYRRVSSRFWFALDRFSTLPDDLVIATTEVGHPSAMNPDKNIVDLVGLNEAEFAQHGFSTAHLFGAYRPDVFYMPHPHYTAMNAAIRSQPEFISGYEVFSAEDLDAAMGVALRRDSRYYAQLRKMLDEARATAPARAKE